MRPLISLRSMMGRGQQGTEAPLLGGGGSYVEKKKKWNWSRPLWVFIAFITVISVSLLLGRESSKYSVLGPYHHERRLHDNAAIIESERGVVAADDGICSEIGASMLRAGGHAVDAAVATALCLGVVNPSSSGIGGGGFMVLWSSLTSKAQAFDMRETAPLAASKDMYENNTRGKFSGALSMGIPGEIAGLHEAWSKHGRLAWKTLCQPAIKLAKEGFVLSPLLGSRIAQKEEMIMTDHGLRGVFAPNGKLLQIGDICYNEELGNTLEAVAEQGPQAFYNGTVGEKFIKDVRDAGGILTMEDLRNYRVEVMDAMTVNVMGHTILGMPPPSSGTLGLSLVLNILESYGSLDAAKGTLGLHRLIEALKHMFAIRMNLGDPKFVDISQYASEMLSRSFAQKLQEKIFDDTTFPPEYYMTRWSQLRDHGTSHFCIVDAERNAVSMTTTINYLFGAGILSPSTGIVLNNEMGDFSTPSELAPDKLPPAPSNFIEPNKRPLSSMTPIIVIKDGLLVGVIGGSGGSNIIAAVIQVFLNHYVFGMEPLAAVENPRVYHQLIPNLVQYENWTLIDGDHIELPEERKEFLEDRGHELQACGGLAMSQFVVQTLKVPPLSKMDRKIGKISPSCHGILTAVSDPRKDGRPAAV